MPKAVSPKPYSLSFAKNEPILRIDPFRETQAASREPRSPVLPKTNSFRVKRTHSRSIGVGRRAGLFPRSGRPTEGGRASSDEEDTPPVRAVGIPLQRLKDTSEPCMEDDCQAADERMVPGEADLVPIQALFEEGIDVAELCGPCGEIGLGTGGPQGLQFAAAGFPRGHEA